jgi:hypothetical protein
MSRPFSSIYPGRDTAHSYHPSFARPCFHRLVNQPSALGRRGSLSRLITLLVRLRACL